MLPPGPGAARPRAAGERCGAWRGAEVPGAQEANRKPQITVHTSSHSLTGIRVRAPSTELAADSVSLEVHARGLRVTGREQQGRKEGRQGARTFRGFCPCPEPAGAAQVARPPQAPLSAPCIIGHGHLVGGAPFTRTRDRAAHLAAHRMITCYMYDPGRVGIGGVAHGQSRRARAVLNRDQCRIPVPQTPALAWPPLACHSAGRLG